MSVESRRNLKGTSEKRQACAALPPMQGRHEPMIRALVQRLPFFYGWAVVGCAMSSNAVRQAASVTTLSIFIVPMTVEFGWSRTGVSGAVSVGALLGALSAPFIGPLFDRHGSRALLIASALAMSACCVALAGTPGLLWFYVAFGVSRMIFSTPFDLGTSSVAAKWFVRRRALAMSLLTTSIGIGLTILPLAVALAIAAGGWRTGWLVLAVIVVVFGVVPQWFLLVREPEDLGLRPDGDGAAPRVKAAGAGGARAADARAAGAGAADAGAADVGVADAGAADAAGEVAFTRAQALRTPALWLVMTYTLIVFSIQAGVSLHWAPHLVERGISPTITATIVGTFSLAIAFSSIVFGYAGDRVPVRATLAASAALMALGAMAMGAASGPPLGYAASVLFGAGVGGILTMPPVALASYFGRAHFGAIRGMALPAQVVGQAGGPLLAGLLHDLTGGYASGLATFAALSLLAAAVAMAARAPRRRRSAG